MRLFGSLPSRKKLSQKPNRKSSNEVKPSLRHCVRPAQRVACGAPMPGSIRTGPPAVGVIGKSKIAVGM